MRINELDQQDQLVRQARRSAPALHHDRFVKGSGLRLIGNTDIHSSDLFFTLDKRYPHAKFTFGSLFLTTPGAG